VPAKFSNGVFAGASYRRTCKLILTDLTGLSSGTDFFSGCYTVFTILPVCVHDEALFRFTVIGFSALNLPEGNVYRDAIRRSLYD